MMKGRVSIIRGVVPFGYVQYYRYYRGWKIVSYVLSDLAPVMLYMWMFSPRIDFAGFVMVWCFFWAFYEIGYLINDCRSSVKEDKPTMRATDGICESFWRVVVARSLIIILLVFLFVAYGYEDEALRAVVFGAIVMFAFQVHNSLYCYKSRIATLLMLGVFKPIYIPLVLGMSVAPLIVALLPTLFVKLFDYATSKGFADFSLRTDRVQRFQFTLSYMPVLLVVDWRLLLVYAPVVLHALLVRITRR